MKKKEIDIAIAQCFAAYQENVFASKIGSLKFKHLGQLNRIANSPHLECKDEPTRSSKAQTSLQMKYFATIYRETSALTMPEYTESEPFDLKICRDEISQIAKMLVISKARGLDAILPILYNRKADTLILSLYIVYRNIVRIFPFPLNWKEVKMIPVFKQGSPTKVQNYRPIRSLNIGSKISEKIIFTRLLDIYIPHMHERQYGFKTGRSLILRQLMTLSENYSNFQIVECVTLFLFDFQNAFDTVRLDIRLKKLTFLP